MRESELERRLRVRIESIGGMVPKWVSPGNRGAPDRLVILPNGVVAFVEMKAPDGQLKPLQKRWRRKLQELGQRYYVLSSEIEVDRFVRDVTNGKI